MGEVLQLQGKCNTALKCTFMDGMDGSMCSDSALYRPLVNVNNRSYLACCEQITRGHEEDKMNVHNSLFAVSDERCPTCLLCERKHGTIAPDL